jgi:dCMP deaminase
MAQDQLKWDNRYLSLAKHVSDWSKDPGTKVGAVITKTNRVVSLGYNGFPEGVIDCETRYANRETKLKVVVHAEPNAIISAKQDLTDCTLYVWPFMPCSSCAGLIIQSGIKRVVSVTNDNNTKWLESFRMSEIMFNESGVKLDLLNFSE